MSGRAELRNNSACAFRASGGSGCSMNSTPCCAISVESAAASPGAQPQLASTRKTASVCSRKPWMICTSRAVPSLILYTGHPGISASLVTISFTPAMPIVKDDVTASLGSSPQSRCTVAFSKRPHRSCAAQSSADNTNGVSARCPAQRFQNDSVSRNISLPSSGCMACRRVRIKSIDES